MSRDIHTSYSFSNYRLKINVKFLVHHGIDNIALRQVLVLICSGCRLPIMRVLEIDPKGLKDSRGTHDTKWISVFFSSIEMSIFGESNYIQVTVPLMGHLIKLAKVLKLVTTFLYIAKHAHRDESISRLQCIAMHTHCHCNVWNVCS